ncbi:hypothetical protein LguiA_007029 [Lonicera macranthoides]
MVHNLPGFVLDMEAMVCFLRGGGEGSGVARSSGDGACGVVVRSSGDEGCGMHDVDRRLGGKGGENGGIIGA